ncbi:SDR family NAD(P)-dependent oxidoreductase [Paraburkholderia silvatlantica]|uniref:NAD(P)-dependent dehydrogenase (Short-subunit alcohol dehydrogenase family) n=1 Tax=Paraburkholderia silvatlantica TaxID=321895 RepID=A0ABR6FYU3_9BURK|nr:SDR family NAD(P)-dependent oxidoreductase [Paraburkholderia silvatlantica]MBB2932604.1 NAD(P)-dependent dehydrogenase (short-subunit alcohol dehydrogenase family) [Paraburkholderia silvatlantica]PVY22287.1 NAD(P)-dependent dehydrogenase (short-subunit alcohol dehydrogenase family) [Paraburkholderia silvatlantica]PXW27094.1 NAD(P)-dependent dehydrogenase (short-subunit alcohol dehydrogenase family) [Paraburkholderia silvatlantica]
MSQSKRIVVVGASRGLGLALAEEYCARNWHVIATSRGQSEGLDELRERYPSLLEIETVDTTDIASIRALARQLETVSLDALFVNAGICKANTLTPLEVAEKDFLDMMSTNALGPMRVVEALYDQIAKQGVIAIMSSELGSIANCTGFWELYSSSKAALNMLMKAFSARQGDKSCSLILIAPGWVQTEMGGANATLEIAQSIPFVVDVVEQSAGIPGLRFVNRHGEILPW